MKRYFIRLLGMFLVTSPFWALFTTMIIVEGWFAALAITGISMAALLVATATIWLGVYLLERY